ncbi:hypothetical protein N7533_001313 [Penicillium manginii]|uniref:uncharacterized protein n=1 Tax=Penicillium manginii TaxID=203109 RepID=UPI0025496479|nr:uncharacterized protein N7533_001313 [Penicillium manginii]KAJ5762632.1 hypothetical protein N7533_001313 [Penicillium manginii]
MRNNICHLPNGLSFTVTPVFGGVTFKSNDMATTNPTFPPGWTVIIHSEKVSGISPEQRGREGSVNGHPADDKNNDDDKTVRFTTPTLNRDCIYISYIVNPPSSEFKPVTSPTRQIAMMLWATLLWYFHEPKPDPHLQTVASSSTPHAGQPKGEWRVNIRREGIFKGRNLLQKLERMGIVSNEDSSVGLQPVETRDSASWSKIHLPTYYPPAPTQYTFTNGLRHPIRPKPPHQGEVFYVRHVPSVGQYLSFRIPFLPATKPAQSDSRPTTPTRPVSSHVTSVKQHLSQSLSSDLDTLHRWMNDPRVEAMWGVGGPKPVQEKFLLDNLSSRHSFPVIGCWDGKPFGYFEIYWVKEDPLGRLLDRVDNYDRGIHVLVGEQEFRGPHRVILWLTALVHHCFLADMRTEAVVLEPRVDNLKLINYLLQVGFYKEGEVSFPHKQSAVMKIKREYWDAPAI